MCAELHAVFVYEEKLEFLDLHLHRFQDDFLVFAGQLVGRHAFDFLCRKGWGNLLNQAAELRSHKLELFFVQRNSLRGAGGIAFGIVGVGGEPETDRALVTFFGMQIELSQPRKIANYEWQYASGHGIERTEVSNRALAENTPDAADHVMRGQAGGLIDNDDAIHAGFGNVVIG